MRPDNKKKLLGALKVKNRRPPKHKQSEDTERASDTDMAGKLDWSHQERKSATITVLRALVDKADVCGNSWATRAGEGSSKLGRNAGDQTLSQKFKTDFDGLPSESDADVQVISEGDVQ